MNKRSGNHHGDGKTRRIASDGPCQSPRVRSLAPPETPFEPLDREAYPLVQTARPDSCESPRDLVAPISARISVTTRPSADRERHLKQPGDGRCDVDVRDGLQATPGLIPAPAATKVACMKRDSGRCPCVPLRPPASTTGSPETESPKLETGSRRQDQLRHFRILARIGKAEFGELGRFENALDSLQLLQGPARSRPSGLGPSSKR